MSVWRWGTQGRRTLFPCWKACWTMRRNWYGSMRPGHWRGCASARQRRRTPIPPPLFPQAVLHPLFREGQGLHAAHAIEVNLALYMVTLVLDDPGVITLHHNVDPVRLAIIGPQANLGVARYATA